MNDFNSIWSAVQNFFLTTAGLIFWFIIILIPLVVIHEFGHFSMARLCRVKIPEFGIGLPFSKPIYSKTWKGVKWSLYPWLLGGFVNIFGDNDAIDQAMDESKTDKQLAKTNYATNRLEELVARMEIDIFLAENGLEYDKEWENYYRLYSLVQKNKSLSETEKESFDRLSSQLEMLIDWEFEAKTSPKTKIKEAFFNKNWIQQTLIISGGVLFNMLTAWVILWILFSFSQTNISIIQSDFQPKLIFKEDIQNLEKDFNIKNKYEGGLLVGSVLADYPLANAGIASGDEIMKVGGVDATQIQNLKQFQEIVQNNKDGLEIVYNDRDPKKLETNFGSKTVTVIPKKESIEGFERYIVGASPSYNFALTKQAKNPFSAIGLSFNETFSLLDLNFRGLGELGKRIVNRDKTALDAAGGPVKIGYIGNEVFATDGVPGILYIMALVSISLALFNALPIPALDGGRFIILTLNKITGKRNRKLEGAVIGGTMLFILGLSIIILLNDIGFVYFR
jgi:regulator of sigma E protease